MDPSRIHSHLLHHRLPTGLHSNTMANTANLSKASPWVPKRRCSYLTLCASCICTQPGKTRSPWHPQGKEDIAHRAVTLPALDAPSKKQHICMAQLPATPHQHFPSQQTGSWHQLQLSKQRCNRFRSIQH